MKFFREHKKISMVIILVSILTICFGTTFARYIYNTINNYILESKGFYFNSSVLSITNKNYKINNWDGVNDYVLTIDVNSKKNSLEATTSDIEYEVEVECPSKVTCTASKTTGTIYQTTKTDSYQIIVESKENFYEGDEVKVTTKARSTSPYVKTLSATYTIGVEKSKFSYSITDSINAKYMTLNLTNAVTYYEVKEAFDTHKVGDQISVEVYNLLSPENKKKCFSAKVTVTFDPKEVYLDMTASAYHNKLAGTEQTQTINNHSYVSSFTFEIPASSSEKILFYKENISKDYTYPMINPTSIIDVTVETAE